MVGVHEPPAHEASSDEADLARFGYKQELKRSLGGFSTFAVAFSYISPSTGIFALFFLVLSTVMNIFGVRLVAIVNNTGVLFEILAMVVFAFVVALFHHHQSAGVIFHTGGTSLTTGTFLIAMFMSLYVIYGFDTASTLAEETKNPRSEAPKAVIRSVIGSFLV